MNCAQKYNLSAFLLLLTGLLGFLFSTWFAGGVDTAKTTATTILDEHSHMHLQLSAAVSDLSAQATQIALLEERLDNIQRQCPSEGDDSGSNVHTKK